MYSLVSAYGVLKGVGQKWNDQDVSTLPVNEIFSKYRTLYLKLSNPYLANEVYININDLPSQYVGFTGTLSDLFTDLGDKALPTKDSIHKYKTKWAIYGDAFSQGFKVHVNVPGQPPDGLARRDEKTEVCIRRDRTDPKKVYEHCLVSVNGYFYPTDYDSNYTYILNAGKSLKRSRRNQVGILSFQEVCKLKQIPLTKDMLYKLDDNIDLHSEVCIKLDEEYKDKYVLLCLAGHLVFPNEHHFYRINETDWMLNLSDIPIIERYFESRGYIDYSSLNLTEFPNNKDKIDIDEFLSDEVLEKYLTHEQSFFIVFDTVNLIREYTYLRNSKLPGMYTAYEEPKSLLFVARGRVAEYWKVYEDGQWAVNVVNSYLPNRTYDSVNANQRKINAGTDTPYKVYYDSRGFLLHLGADVEDK